ncbi:hypothetical protein UFOVP1382_132 [uncultured Caudovirales phage]|uniref:Uncharacterized protein n=1 Tax=uncultured Caudovirales phage TaxID=2100421 RepID=A0A6J5S551_9CAUD|nr:hypothetical protein UFOVP1382_132 [uncultured Caudovirales phage]
MRTFHRDVTGDILTRKTPCGLQVLPPIFSAAPPAISKTGPPDKATRADYAARLNAHWCHRCFPETD